MSPSLTPDRITAPELPISLLSMPSESEVEVCHRPCGPTLHPRRSLNFQVYKQFFSSIMHLATFIGAAVVAFTSSALATPLSAVQMGSKHNLYLSTCATRSALPGCPLIIICPKAEETAALPYIAAAYFETTNKASPTEVAIVSLVQVPWEGFTRSARLRNGAFSSSIAIGGKTLAKSAIAGMAKVGREEFICFRDGETKFEAVSDGIIGEERSQCVADYWCASLDV
jgi:hypothetical protein